MNHNNKFLIHITNHDSNEEILNKINACAKKAKFSLSILSLKDDKLAQEINKRDERGYYS